MPVVFLRFDHSRLTSGQVKKIAGIIPSVVAQGLNVPENKDAHLIPDDVEVWISECHVLDIGKKSLQIVVFVNEFPERKDNLSVRAKFIAELIKLSGTVPKGLLGQKKCFVWVRLATAEFVEF